MDLILEEKLNSLRELFLCGEEVHSWIYNTQGTVLSANHPDSQIMDEVFRLCGCMEQINSHFSESRMPLCLGERTALCWIAVSIPPGAGGKPVEFVILGPALTEDFSYRNMIRFIRANRIDNTHISTKALNEVFDRSRAISLRVLRNHAIMVHKLLWNESLSSSDICYTDVPLPPGEKDWKSTHDRHATWLTEQALLGVVRDGNLDYRRVLENSQRISDGVPIASAPLDQTKISTIVFISLCTRAAIKGGLTPEDAYSLGDKYIQKVYQSNNMNEISNYNQTMYSDFINRVHNCQIRPDISTQMKNCCDYIDLHITDRVGIKELASYMGYTEYYLSRRFKKELGVSVNTYVKEAKIKHARLLLTTTNDSIQQIADILGFSSRNYFSEVFTDIVGQSPVDYREKHKNC